MALEEALAEAWELSWVLVARTIARVLVRALQAAALGEAGEALVQWCSGESSSAFSGSAYGLSYTLTHHERCQ